MCRKEPKKTRVILPQIFTMVEDPKVNAVGDWETGLTK